jgi:hypothetical protein
MSNKAQIFNAVDVQIVRYHIMGYATSDIANLLQRTANYVNSVISSPFGQELICKYINRQIDTILDVQTMAQMIAPACMEEKLRLALHSNDEKVRSTNTRDILEMAGHTAQRTILLDRTEKPDRIYDGLSEAEIKASLLAAIAEETGEKTLH